MKMVGTTEHIANIFGPYIRDTRVIPMQADRENRKDQKQRMRELEILSWTVEDYIEQA